MSFLKASESSTQEVPFRIKNRERLLSFGIKYLDDSMIGILPNDLILIGAASGAGKTQICCNIALSNIEQGKRVHYIALEAELYEIERRMKYQLFSKYFFQDPERPTNVRLNFQNWMMGDLWESCKLYEAQADDEFQKKYQQMFTFYKQEKFDVEDMIFHVTAIANETDLIIIDHVHYFDYNDEKENTAIKEIAKTARMLTIEQGKPMIMVSHLRKRDRSADEICPGIEEFHGSSDLYKIATKAIIIAPGDLNNSGGFDTFFRIVKNRFDGSVVRFMGKISYNSKKGRYEKEYAIGQAMQTRGTGFSELDQHAYPEWAKRGHSESGNGGNDVKGKPLPNEAQKWKSSLNGYQGHN